MTSARHGQDAAREGASVDVAVEVAVEATQPLRAQAHLLGRALRHRRRRGRGRRGAPEQRARLAGRRPAGRRPGTAHTSQARLFPHFEGGHVSNQPGSFEPGACQGAAHHRPALIEPGCVEISIRNFTSFVDNTTLDVYCLKH